MHMRSMMSVVSRTSSLSGTRPTRSVISSSDRGSNGVKPIGDITRDRNNNNEQLQLLKSLGCDLAQGYLFSTAVPPAQVPRLARFNFKAQRPDIHLAHWSAEGQ